MKQRLESVSAALDNAQKDADTHRSKAVMGASCEKMLARDESSTSDCDWSVNSDGDRLSARTRARTFSHIPTHTHHTRIPPPRARSQLRGVVHRHSVALTLVCENFGSGRIYQSKTGGR